MNKVLAIVGPTASGKTKLAIEVAKRLNGEIISADSRQIYRNIPIATSSPSSEELNLIPHHFIGELNLDKEFSAGEFGTKARERLEEIFLRCKQPVIAGGSGLYIRSLVDGFFEQNVKNTSIRRELYHNLEVNGEESLYKELQLVDESAAIAIPPRKIRRVIRALEVYYSSGKRISDLQKSHVKMDYKTVQIGLMLDRRYLYQRINYRVDNMVTNGLIQEVEKLKRSGYNTEKHISLNTVGVKEVFKYFAKECDYETMVSLIKQNSRRYAKRQLTWFRKDKRINWINVNENSDVNELVEAALEVFRSN